MVATRTSKSEREELTRYSRRREAVAVEEAKARSEHLLADFELQMATCYKPDDDAWASIVAEAKGIVAEANAHIAAKCRESGIPAEVAPQLNLGWASRGENMLKERRAELRKVAQTQLAAEERRAVAEIKRRCVEFEGLVLSGGLESEEARELLASMPAVADLMPPLDAGKLQAEIPGLPDIVKRYGDQLYALDGRSRS